MKSILKKTKEKLIVYKEATDKHNEITVAIIEYQLTLPFMLSGMYKIIQNMNKHMQTQLKLGWPGLDSPTLYFTVKAKTERHEADTNDWQVANKVVLAKAHAKACAISQKICTMLWKELKSMIVDLEYISINLSHHELKEKEYIRNV